MSNDDNKRIFDKLDRIDDRLERKTDAIEARLNDIDKILIKQEENLKQHMARTEILEKSHKEMHEELMPIKKVFTVAWGICRIIAGLAMVAGIVKVFLGM